MSQPKDVKPSNQNSDVMDDNVDTGSKKEPKLESSAQDVQPNALAAKLGALLQVLETLIMAGADADPAVHTAALHGHAAAVALPTDVVPPRKFE